MVASDPDVKRIAIQKEGYFPILFQLNPSDSLQVVISKICSKWTMQKPEQYSLQYLDSKIYITEENRSAIHDGEILTLNFNIELAAAKFLLDIEQPDLDVKRRALDLLAGIDSAGQADDPLFAREFVNRHGINALVKLIESDTEPGEVIAQAITSIQVLHEHGIFSWENVERSFVNKIFMYANQSKGKDSKIVQRSLSLLENIVTVSSTLFIRVMNEVNLENLVEHIRSNDVKLQISAMSLCNSILQRMEHDNRKKFAHTLALKGYTNVLQQLISTSSGQLSGDIKHQLYVYQALLLSLLEPRTKSRPDLSDPKLIADLNTMYNVAFESASVMKDKASGKISFKRLGFASFEAPLEDFNECPPGMLAFDAMLFFSKKHRDQYVKVILENFGRDEEHECPFAKCTKQLTKMLCDVLGVGEAISDTSEQYQPMFFTTEDIFEELYSVSIQLLNKTWKEMRATAQDFPRVIGVVKDQVKRVLRAAPETVDKFKIKAFSLTYPQILRLMQQEAEERNILDSQTKPVMELREQILPEVRELVRQQRLSRLVEGQMFSHFSRRGQVKDKYWFCCLSPNHRFLHFGDVTSNDRTPSIDTLPNKIPLSEVSSIKTGKDCPHIARLKKGLVQVSFSIMYNQEENLDFVAPTQVLFSVWTDALNSLIGKEMTSPEFHSDLEMLLNMEMKLLLLDLENVRIPEVAPPIPREPDNYDFYYKDNL